MMPSNATSLQSEEQSDDRQQIPMNSLPESQGKGNLLYDSRSWKACLQGFRPGPAEMRLYW